ncbi:hypothetical protein P152DRAFT_486496 [Eremomyces bilateralis CBS 781.70]|uniref:Uncharacterized protein n=1 Tax=Eremomyces bilateralis CBS 781.70 TaxID=1392243 RepID=A0A6G1GGA7_9PEZI|nr:uncharacterized protein P152DRAFT_486496 [Eremomyces bilateralis CBS 781.70]KAF1817098.1 hypothetical protein P152DRAFT_486496 [Eremomyces bilateralis CBS 781.70]
MNQKSICCPNFRKIIIAGLQWRLDRRFCRWPRKVHPSRKALSSAHVLILPRLPRSSFLCLRRWPLCWRNFQEILWKMGRVKTGKQALIVPLKQFLSKSPKLWENPVRGVVVKCNDDIVAKVILGNRNYTEYTSMEFLAERAPDIPAPRSHGLIPFGPFRVIFMSYIPDTTLAQAWSGLSHEGKLSTQQQLEDIFCN